MFKFANLARRNPHRKNANLKNVRRVSAIAPLNVQWGWWGFGGGRGDAS
ncbi:hypothetical protein CAMSH0001_1639 [Campylobacter showae RM3277]|uniref:Uncharacterized protein n=1 Tax=Campylobacter showae RM3277 TaxID=553219 RepID=C6RH05_9BACT|nr:hypothetical protein CAMSH0001_1639 [Campylobacter showae RM3277]